MAACYLLWFTKRFFEKLQTKKNELLSDFKMPEKFCSLPMVVLIFWFGVYPQTFMKYLEPRVRVI